MNASNLDLMRLAQAMDGEFDPADYTPEELDEMLGYIRGAQTVDEIRARYFEFYDDIKDRTLNTHKWSD
ncbi:MAG: hypothetical protein ACI4L9_04790 [Candidatus Coproplasma sp.]